MGFQVSSLSPNNAASFWPVFAEVLKSEFPGYSNKIVDYFLQKTYTQASFAYWLENGMKTVFTAADSQKIVGFAVMDEPYGGVSFCRWLGVKKSHQRRGIGRKLIDSWLYLAKTQKCHKVEIASQPEARGFYEKVGLSYEGERKLSYFGITQYLYGNVIGKIDDESMVK